MKVTSTTAAMGEFRSAMEQAGLSADSIIGDGKIHRIKVAGDRAGGRSGWYVFFLEGLPAGAFGDWREATNFKWCAKPDHEISPEEREANKKRMEEIRAAREAELARQHERARREAQEIWNAAPRAPETHAYLARKGVKAHGLKVDAESRLIVPLRDSSGLLRTIETIGPGGEKLFYPGGGKRSCFFALGTGRDVEKSGKILICEGFATAASLREATALPVAAAMDAGNLRPVAEALRLKYSQVEFIFCADSDTAKGHTRGEDAAREAAQAVGGRVVVCPAPGDFNDFLQAQGPKAVRAALGGPLNALEPERDRRPSKGPSPIEWPELEPLFRPLPPGEPFPLDALGEVLGGGARAIAEIRRIPEGSAAQSVLTAGSLAAQPFADVEMDGLRQPTGLFHLTVLPSGEGKSIGDVAALAPAEETQARLMEAYRAEEAPRYRRDFALWEEGKRQALRQKNHAARAAALDELGEEPEAPAPPILLATDPTYEGLTRIFAAGWPTLALANDEGGGFLGGWAMNPEHRMGTLSRLSRLWDRGEVERLRAGGEQGRFPGRRLTFHLMMQPHVAGNLLSDPLANEQGFNARCLMCAPEPLPAEDRRYTGEDVRNDPRYQKFSDRMLALHDRPLPWRLDARGRRNGLDPRVLRPNAMARTVWIGLHGWVLQNLDHDGPLAPVREAANKAAQHALRLAAILTLANDPDATEIGPREMEGAAILARFYLGEALRLTGAAALDADLALAARLFTWLREGGAVRLDDGRAVIWPVRVYQTGPSPLRAKADALRILGVLESHGWLRHIGAEVAGGAKRNALWEVRPGAE